MFSKKYPKYAFNSFPHDLLLNFSDDNLFEPSDPAGQDVDIDLPVPIHSPFKISEFDIVTKLVNEKRAYLEAKAACSQKFTKDSAFTTHFKDGDEYVTLTKGLVKFYQQQDPDKYFSSDYNVYYTGGVLEHMKIGHHNVLIRPDTENNLCLTDISHPETTHILHKASTPIFNINHVDFSDKLFLSLREKLTVTIAQVKQLDDIDLIWSKTQKGTPFVGVILSTFNAEEVAVIDANKKFQVFDIAYNKVVYKNSISSKEVNDSFTQMEFLDENTLIVIDRNSLNTVDLRSGETKTSKMDLENCNSLSVFKILEDKTVLLASRHYLLKTDLRNMDTISSFSHSLRSVPCYMSIIDNNCDKFVALSGQNMQYKVLFANRSLYSLPYVVPSIMSTYKQCRLRKDILLRDGLTEYLKFSTAGIKLVEQGFNYPVLYSVDSLGNIFRQKICDYKSDIEEPIEIFYKWVETLDKPTVKLYPTNVANMSAARFALDNAPNEEKLKPYFNQSKAKEFLLKFDKYNENIKSTFAKDLLSVWLDDEDEDKTSNIANDKEPVPIVRPEDKVMSWIDGHTFHDDTSFNLLPNFLNNGK